jgi:mannose-6-phosphate isomerase
MSDTLLYPLRFEPIYQYRLWGGQRLANLLSVPLPGDGPIGEAWILSDRDDHQSPVSNGPLKGRNIGQVLEQFPEQTLGKLASRFHRFPLLLKFLDACEMLSVQVHPTAANADLLPAGETAKTEAWVVLEAGPKSRIYAGLKPGTTADDLRRALTNGGVADTISLPPNNALGLGTATGSTTTDGSGKWPDHYYVCSTACPGSSGTVDASQSWTANSMSMEHVNSIVYSCTSITIDGH